MTGIRRRAILRGGVLGLTTLAAGAAAGLGAAPAGALTRMSSRNSAERHLVVDYRPSRPTGLPMIPGQSLGQTLGGHTVSRDFTYNDRPHRVALLGFDRPGDLPDPIYEEVPADPELRFRETLETAYGAYYSFRYQGKFGGRDQFRVQSYGVVVREPTASEPATSFGGGMYVVYEPDRRRGDPALDDALHWIQVAAFLGSPNRPAEVDAGPAHPFYSYGGLSAINGNEVFNFHDMPQIGVMGLGTVNTRFLGEAFLARDAGRRDAKGRTIVDVFGGIKYGWHARELPA
ncbi:hypothetical protein [Embleya scabrispora]|uniref:hypothetical protein n=1 Tax=Embleya scabrispora TaxID=159449 RepID=UPI0003681DE1|nr:hypothetical protein [Embleya scabrispora]MYS85160.1 hypothetical protein [Streptomyces sp. SID5474]